jgi:hypothetical protein
MVIVHCYTGIFSSLYGIISIEYRSLSVDDTCAMYIGSFYRDRQPICFELQLSSWIIAWPSMAFDGVRRTSKPVDGLRRPPKAFDLLNLNTLELTYAFSPTACDVLRRPSALSKSNQAST